MKKSLITILIIVILAGVGYFVYTNSNKICTTDAPMAKNIKTGEIRGFSNGCIPRGWERVQYEDVQFNSGNTDNTEEVKNNNQNQETIELLDTIDDSGKSIFKFFKVNPWVAKSIDEYEYVYEFNFSDERARVIITVDNGKPYAKIENGEWSADGFSDVSRVENLTNVRIEGNKFYSNKINGEFIYVDKTYRSGGNYKMYYLKIYEAWKGEFLNETYDSQTRGPILGHQVSKVKKPEAPTPPKTNTTTTYMCEGRVKIVRVQDSPSLPPRISYLRVSDNAGIASYGDFGAYIRPEYFSIDRSKIEEGYSFNEVNFCKYLKN